MNASILTVRMLVNIKILTVRMLVDIESVKSNSLFSSYLELSTAIFPLSSNHSNL